METNDCSSKTILYYADVSILVNKRPVGLIAPPFIIGFLATENEPNVSSNIVQNHSSFAQIHMKCWSKLGQVGVGSNIAQNHSSSL